MKSDQNVHRVLLAAILASEMSQSEIRRFAQDLDDTDVVRSLQQAIFMLADIVGRSGKRREPRKDHEDELLSVVQRKRLSKAEVRDRMMAVSPNLTREDLDQATTLREMVSFFARRFPANVSRLISLIEDGQGDAYLKGIIRR